ncbi:hypothetical protein BHYA_0005g01060 [Botrytis hyacinthi]|uniref:Uncharacterized protein n=1 Tax=Botrytis hyacinthi TaxID=278943 RepID=A0A4Z1H7J7_9HELO|nr:hypothetical protein BHYA_0005g01060 [Botrytis hyacinthi]
MTGFRWTYQADTLFIWVAGGVWRHENQVGDFMDALNKLEPFDKGRVDFNPESIRMHVHNKGIQWKQPQWVERPSWLSEDVLKGQFGEVGLEALHESTSRLRRATGSDTAQWRESVQNRERILQSHIRLAANNKEFLRQEKKAARRQEKAPRKRFREEEKGKAAQRQEEAQMERFWREEKEIREQEFRSGVKELGYTEDAESSGGLSWAQPNASGFHDPEPEPDSYAGAFRDGVAVELLKDRFKE